MKVEGREREERERKKEEEDKEATYYNNLLYYPKTYFNKSFCFPNTQEVRELFKDLDAIGQRDGWTKSHTFLTALKEYVEHHPLPNPQAQIDRMLEVQMPHKPVHQCCVGSCRRKAEFLETLKDFEGKTERFQVCSIHKNWRHPRFKFLVNYRQIR